MKRCTTTHCRGLVGPRDHSDKCPKCKAIQWKANHPVSYFFHKLRTSATRRGIAFTLSREKFAELWAGGLAAKHGKTKFSLSVDRKRNTEGYHDGNVQLLTLSENSRKQFVPHFRDQAAQEAAIAETQKQIKEAYPELANHV